MKTRRIAITGASGNIGVKLRAYLLKEGAEFVLFDRDPRGDPEIMAVDLAVYDDAWVSRIAGVDALVHLAAVPIFSVPWRELERDNVDATLNVLEAARKQNVPRVILASSVQAVLGKVGREARIDEQGPGEPVNYYGATKCVLERLGKHYARHFGLSVIALRFGWVQKGENQTGQIMAHPENFHLWLSNGDVCRGIDSAIRATGVSFGVFTLVSDNKDMPWDLSAAAQVLNWTPQDRCSFIPPPAPPAPDAREQPRSGRGIIGRLRGLLRRWR